MLATEEVKMAKYPKMKCNDIREPCLLCLEESRENTIKSELGPQDMLEGRLECK